MRRRARLGERTTKPFAIMLPPCTKLTDMFKLGYDCGFSEAQHLRDSIRLIADAIRNGTTEQLMAEQEAAQLGDEVEAWLSGTEGDE